MNLLSVIKQAIMNRREPRLRDRRAFYASELTKDMRDLFWSLTGEEATNPSDIVGSMRMDLGNAIEGFVVEKLRRGQLFGLKLLGTQVSIGGSEPVAVDGYLDALVELPNGSKAVVEVKSKWGWGAEFFCRDLDPGEAYMAQMGYYLRETTRQGVTSQGVFIFIPVGDNTFGDLIAIYCKYNDETGVVTAYAAQSIHEEEARPINPITLNMNTVLERLKAVEGYVQRNELPPQDKFYKFPVDAKMLADARDSDLEKALEGTKVVGDWEIAYSSYKNKHIELQGVDPSNAYSEAELSLIAEELEKRTAAKKAAANQKRAATNAAKQAAGIAAKKKAG